jgi:flagellar biosynthesis protein FlhA
VLPIVIIGAILVFVVPLPPLALDVLLAGNIALAVVVLLTVLAVRTPLEFSAFPTILVTTTLTRLVLNVATTRQILVRGGEAGLDAAGGVIRPFGDFVAQDQIVVGMILFAILVVIQFVVITKGATRISEVAARFVLDGLPGRQMAIDADVHAGLIDHAEAAKRRDAVYRQADFFGAMDGASKFVRGDAVAGVIITFVNILGGLYMGVIQHGMPIDEAANVFTRLTIGDGLVTQVPAFLISLAAGLIVTRSSSESDLGREVTRQLFSRADVLGLAAGFLALLSFTELPKAPLLAIAAALGTGSWLLWRRERQAGLEQSPQSEPTLTRHERVAGPVPARTGLAESATEPAPTRVDDLLQVEPLELEIGFRLIGLADPSRGGELLERLQAIRHRVARELGVIVPQILTRDDPRGIRPNEYRLKIRGVVAGSGTAHAGRLLAIPPSGLVSPPEGRDGLDPVTGAPAVWIHADGRELAELSGCRVLEAPAVIAAHLDRLLHSHADLLLTHEQIRTLLDRVNLSAPGLVEEVVPGLLRVGELRRLLQNLVRERVGIRDLEAILEVLAEHAPRSRDLVYLGEQVRAALGRQITSSVMGADGRLHAVALGAGVESRLAQAARASASRPDAALGFENARGLLHAVRLAIAPLVEGGQPLVVLCSPECRTLLRDLTRGEMPELVVLSTREVPRDVAVEVVGSVIEEEPTQVPRSASERVSMAEVK